MQQESKSYDVFCNRTNGFEWLYRGSMSTFSNKFNSWRQCRHAFNTNVTNRFLDDRRAAKQALRLGIKVDALSSFYTNPTPEDCGLVIGYGNTSKEEIPYAVGILAEVVK